MSLKFGTPVKVNAIADRLKKTVSNSVHTSHRDAIRYRSVYARTWVGEPLPDTSVDPDHKAAVMIRRHPSPSPVTGIVVGLTWREEGYVQPGGYEDPGYLARRGPRIPLYEVALSQDKLGKGRLVLAHEIDLEEL